MGVILKLISVVLAFLSVFGGGNGGTVMYEPAEPYLMLSAHTSNWSGARIGDWSGTSWDIFSDGSYEMQVSCFHDMDEEYKPKVYTGTMTAKELRQLREACDCEWVDPEVHSHACDGQGWEITMFGADGNVIHSSGEYAYINGQKNLIAIVMLLPRPDREPAPQKKATLEYFRTVTESTTHDEIIRAIGPPDSMTGSGITTYHWELDDGASANVTFDIDNTVMTLIIVKDGKVSEWIVR